MSKLSASSFALCTKIPLVGCGGPEAGRRIRRPGSRTRGLGKPSAGRKFIPGGCAAAKPAPRTRTYIYITPSQGLGGCHAVSRQKIHSRGLRQPSSRLRAPGRTSTSPQVRDSGAAMSSQRHPETQNEEKHKISTRLDTQADPKFGDRKSVV